MSEKSAMHVIIAALIHDGIRQVADIERRSVGAQVELALEGWMRSNGYGHLLEIKAPAATDK